MNRFCRSRLVAGLLFGILLVSIPCAALASSAATGTITGLTNVSFNEQVVISDGVTSYSFVFQNGGGGFNGLCVDGSFNHYAQPCVNGDLTVIDTGGGAGGSDAQMVSRTVAAINGTAIGVTASADGDGVTVDLVNDTVGSAGNVSITETVLNTSFVVTGMSGGTDGSPVPEFSTYIYMLTLAVGAWYIYTKMRFKSKNEQI